MLEFLRNLLGSVPSDIAVVCPDTGATGYIATQDLIRAWNLTVVVSMIAVAFLVVWCYSATKTTTGPQFSVRWLWTAVAASGLSAVVTFVILKAYPFTIDQATCGNGAEVLGQVSRQALPGDYFFPAIAVRFVWGIFAFVALSSALTATIGRRPWAGGFFHNRGVPFPKFLPFSKAH